jgi:hypothetical protein
MPTFVEDMGGKFFLLGPLVIEIGGGKKFLPTHFLPFPPSIIVVRSTALGRREPIIFFPKDIKIFPKFYTRKGQFMPTHIRSNIYSLRIKIFVVVDFLLQQSPFVLFKKLL